MIPVRASYDAAIVGGGVSGSSVLLALAQVADAQFRVALFDPERPGPGTAYGDQPEMLLMNGPADSMSVMPGERAHLMAWLRTAAPRELIPRKQYGQYVSSTVEAALARRPRFERHPAEIVDVEPGADGYVLTTGTGERFSARQVVLALGNFAPDGAFLPPVIREHESYHGDPWRLNDISKMSGDVAILGSRLTALDVLALLEKNDRCKHFFLISRHGILPHLEDTAIKGLDPRTLGLEIATPYQLLRTLRLAAKAHVANGGDWRGVVESIRSITPAIWLGWSARERRRFLRHLQSFWAAHRYRVPPATYAAWRRLHDAGRVTVVKGRVVAASRDGKNLRMTIARAGVESVIQAGTVINATGPGSDYSRIERPLVQNMLRRGLIRADELRLGIDATPDFNVISHTGGVQPQLFSIGPPIRGLHYETTAVPEIVRQAHQIGAQLCRALQNLGAVS